MIGYDKPLYDMPFDHRGSFQKGLFGITGDPTPEQTAEIASYKKVIYDGFLWALEQGVPQDRAAILVDEQFGADIARDAKKRDIILMMPVEKSGQDEFDFQYGDDFGAHIEEFDVNFAKALVRYNPEGDADLNKRQTERLVRLGEFVHAHDRKYLFELLVPAEPRQLEAVDGDKKRYDREMRPGLMVRAIADLQANGVEVDVWKLEGVDRREDCEAIAKQARHGGRDMVGCIVLGRGENEAKVLEWLTVAKGVPGWIGFAVGRTTFWDALVALKNGEINRDTAVETVGRNYKKWCDLFMEGE
jgi:5-dehydro-2-deoxygluconokinase